MDNLEKANFIIEQVFLKQSEKLYKLLKIDSNIMGTFTFNQNFEI